MQLGLELKERAPLPAVGAQHSCDRAIGRPWRLRRRRLQRPEPGSGERRPGQGSLAGPGLAGEQHEGASACLGGRRQLRQPAQTPVASALRRAAARAALPWPQATSSTLWPARTSAASTSCSAISCIMTPTLG